MTLPIKFLLKKLQFRIKCLLTFYYVTLNKVRRMINRRREVGKFKTNNVARVSKWNEQSITIELGIVFVPRCSRDGDESQTDPYFAQRREGPRARLKGERDCVTPSGKCRTVEIRTNNFSNLTHSGLPYLTIHCN